MARQDFSTLQDRSAEAESLLGHRIFGIAVTQLKQSYADQLGAIKIGDTEKLIAVHTKMKLIDEIVGELRSTVTAVRLAAKSQVEDP